MAHGYILEAEYQDGYIHNEAALNDTSPYDLKRNVFGDIVARAPVPEHGKMVRFSMLPEGAGQRFDIPWVNFPDNAKPIYYRHMHRVHGASGVGEDYASAHFVGYEYWNREGVKIKSIIKAFGDGYEIIEHAEVDSCLS